MDEKNTETNGDGAMDEETPRQRLYEALAADDGLTTEMLWAGVRECAQWIDARAAAAEKGDMEQEDAEWEVCATLDSLRWWMHYFDKTEHREPEEEEEA